MTARILSASSAAALSSGLLINGHLGFAGVVSFIAFIIFSV